MILTSFIVIRNGLTLSLRKINGTVDELIGHLPLTVERSHGSGDAAAAAAVAATKTADQEPGPCCFRRVFLFFLFASFHSVNLYI